MAEGGQLEECGKGFGLGKGNGSGLKEVEGERKGGIFGQSRIGREFERVAGEKTEKRREKNVSESKG